MSSPPSRIWPASGRSMPVIRLISVVLPAPFGPISAYRTPRRQVDVDVARRRPASRSSCRGRAARERRRVHVAPPARAASVRQAAEDAVRQQHHHGDQQKPDPEIPVLRIDAGELVARDHVDHGADEAAIEPSGAAEHEHHQHFGRALEAERLERDGFGGLRQQRAGDARRWRRRWCRWCGYARGSARRSPACARRSRGCRAATGRTANGSAGARTGTPRTARRAHSYRRCSRRDRTGNSRAAARCGCPAGRPCRRSASPRCWPPPAAAGRSPSVIMISARCRNRQMMKLVT